MSETAVLTPAYGRDYKSAKAAEDDFKLGKDFIYHNPASRWNGKYCSIRDFKTGDVVEIRFNKRQDAIAVKIEGGKM